MRNLRVFFPATAALALCLAAGCSSADTVAASAAAEAQADLDQGHLADARIAIKKALAARDDVFDYWLLKARIDLKGDDRQSAFADYQYAIQLDHANTDVLQSLCQLGISVADPDELDGYADQLLMLSPGSAPALNAKGNVALKRGDTDKAEDYANRVLAQDPQNMQASALKAQVLEARGRFADAAALLEKTPDSPGKLEFLEQVYAQAHDRQAYERTLARLAAANPNDANVQLTYADTLYQDGQNGPARGIIRRLMAAYPSDLHVAATALNVWMQAGPQALDPGRMVPDAAGLSLLMKADYAQFANETGHPDIAIAILRGADQGDPTPDNSNAKAALAYAIGLQGDISQAMAQLSSILDDDPNQPWALLARARLLAASRDYTNAIRDARLLVVNDPENADAYLTLADILKARGSADLSEIALREGLRAIPTSTRLAARLAAALSARGDQDQAAEVARDLFRVAPIDQRAMHLLETYDSAAAAAINA